jgi:transcriptional regulator with XRE-family HTH domain
MAKLKQQQLAPEARRKNMEQLARLGADVRTSRLRRRLTQARLAARVGLAQSTISEVERGQGGSHTADALQRIAIALDRSLRIEFARDPIEEPLDAGHLSIQELVLRIARPARYTRRFELVTRPSDPSRSADVGLIDERLRRLILVECINTLTDFGAAVRAAHRKRAEAEDLATARGGGYHVGVCWVVRDVRRNRELVARYPEIFATQFPGSSLGWLRALTQGGPPPDEMGLIWTDAAATRLFARRATPRR